MPSWEDFKPFIITGLALGGVYSLSGVGMVVLYRATGVLNLAFGAVGALGALIAWQLINHNGWAAGPAYVVCVLVGGVLTLLYGVFFGPPLAGRDPLVKATATLGLALILLGVMDLVWSDKARSMVLPSSNHGFEVSNVLVNYTQVISLGFGILVDGLHRRLSALLQASAPRCVLSPTIARSPPRWACPSGASRRPRGSGQEFCPAQPAFCFQILWRSTPSRSPSW